MMRILLRSFLLWIISVLLLLIAAYFILVRATARMPLATDVTDFTGQSASMHDAFFRQWYFQSGQHLPEFYFSIHSAALPEIYFHPLPPAIRHNIKHMAYHFGEPHRINIFLYHLEECRPIFYENDSTRLIYHWLTTQLVKTTEVTMPFLQRLAQSRPYDRKLYRLYQAFVSLCSNQNKFRKYLPVISFHADNRFHRFLFGSEGFSKGLLRGDLGISWQTRQPVAERIMSSLKWTFILSFLALIFSLAISFTAGMKSGLLPGSLFDKMASAILFFFYSIPAFWLAVLLLMCFSNPHVLQWLPSAGVHPPGGFPADASWIDRLIGTLPYLILPVVCLVIPSLAFLSRALRAAVIEVASQNFILMARARGLSRKTIVRKYIFRNVLPTVITLLALAIPALFSGSVVIETIFSIPGIGWLTHQAVQHQDFPLLYGLFLVSGILTLLSFAIADWLHRLIDPRLKSAG
jgi:peptide/nickel transport system permease protein